MLMTRTQTQTQQKAAAIINQFQREDSRWLDMAARLSARARPLSAPNPGVGALVTRLDILVGRGWTEAGGRPHAEAIALKQAGNLAEGACVYVTLEPCAHQSGRGPACANLLVEAGVKTVVIGQSDPDPRTNGAGISRLKKAGIAVRSYDNLACKQSLSGYLTRQSLGRPHVTLKLATSLDGQIALARAKANGSPASNPALMSTPAARSAMRSWLVEPLGAPTNQALMCACRAWKTAVPGGFCCLAGWRPMA